MIDFEWDVNLDQISDFEKEKAEELLEKNMIKDVYLENNNIVVEYFLQCQESVISSLATTEQTSKKMKLPLTLKDIRKVKCKNKANYQCTFNCCIIAIAGYLYYESKKNNYYSNIIDDYNVWDDEDDEDEVLDTYEDIQEIFTTEELEKYKTLIYSINNDVLLSSQIKKEFLSLIKNLINYNSLKNIMSRPNYNYSISESTETVNNVCFGQLRCINTLKLIFETFEIIKSNSKIKKDAKKNY